MAWHWGAEGETRLQLLLSADMLTCDMHRASIGGADRSNGGRSGVCIERVGGPRETIGPDFRPVQCVKLDQDLNVVNNVV